MGYIEDRWTNEARKGKGRRWRAVTRGPDGKRRSASFHKRRDADRWVHEQELAKDRGELDTEEEDQRDRGGMLFGDWWDQWMETREAKPTTLSSDTARANKYVLPRWADTPLNEIRNVDALDWLNELKREDLAPATVRKVLHGFTAPLRAAVKAERLAVYPLRTFDLPKVPRQQWRLLTTAEIYALADAIDPGYRAWVLVAAFSGLRAGELTALRRDRLRPRRREVEVLTTLSFVGGDLVETEPKTENAVRRVRLPQQVWDVLMEHVDALPEEEDHIFPAPSGGPMRVNNFRRRQWEPALQRVGLEGLRLHDLRHTAVSQWIHQGANPVLVSRRAGHGSVSFTLDRYGGLYDEADDQLIDALEAEIAGVEGGENGRLRAV